MANEMTVVPQNHIWDLVPPPPNANIFGNKWVFRIKQNSDKSIARHKARLVAKGYNHEIGIDYDETFNPFVKIPTVQLVLSIATMLKWSVRQLDVSNVFLHGFLDKPIYMVEPTSFVDRSKPDYVYQLRKSLYGLKQALCAWYLY